MASTRTENKLVALPLGLAIVDLAFQKNAVDPLNPVKFWVLGILALWCFADIASGKNWRQYSARREFKSLIAILGIFAFGCLLAFYFTDVSTTGLLGESGRNLGLLNYIFLVIIIIYSAIKIDFFNLKYIFNCAEILLLALSIYGYAQHFNHDFLKWKNQYSPVILMTGNPDFAASLISILLILTFANIFFQQENRRKVLLAGLSVLSLPALYWTHARQGMITALVGIGFILSVLIWSKSKRIGLGFIALEIALGLMSLLGTLQIGPLTKLLYKDSIRDRGYDWKAAISMFKSHPITGVGLDRYGAYFTQYRSPQYPLIYGYQQTVTNAHNVFLELFATGGIILGTSYLLLTIFIGIQAVSLFKSATQKNRIVVTGLIAAWVAFVAQSCISVDCLAISIWGWTLGGVIIGLSIRSSLATTDKKAYSGRPDSSQEPSAYRGLIFLGLIFSFLLIVVPMYRNETNISKFIASGAPKDPKYQASYLAVAESDFNQTFMSPNYKFQTAVALIKNNYGQEGLNYLNLTIKADKRHLDSYVLLSRIYEDLHFVNLPKAIEARKEIVKLDPYNAENLLGLENDYLLIKQKDQAQQMAFRIQEIAPNTDVAKTAAAILKK